MGTTALDYVLKDDTRALDSVLAEQPHTPQVQARGPGSFDIGRADASLPGQVIAAGSQMVQHPIESAKAIVTAPFKAVNTAGQFMGQSAAETSLPPDIAARALSDPDRIDEPSAALAGLQLALPTLPLTGVIGRGVVGAATGAAYMPEQPAVGAVIGGVGGMAHGAVANDPHAIGVRVQVPEEAPAPEAVPAERQLANPNKVVPTALARVLDEYEEPKMPKVTVSDADVVAPPEQSAAVQPSPAPETPAEVSPPTDTPLAGGGEGSTGRFRFEEADPGANKGFLRVRAYPQTTELDVARGSMPESVGDALFDPTGKAINAWVHPEYRRQGVATGIYDWASKRLGVPVRPDEPHMQSDTGKAFWADRNAQAVSDTPVLDEVLADTKHAAVGSSAPFLDGQGYEVPTSDEDEPHVDQEVKIPQGPHPAPRAPGLPSRGAQFPSVQEIKDHVIATFNPRAASAGAYDTGGTIRAVSSAGQRATAISKQQLANLSRYAGKLSRTESTNLINLQERTPKDQDVKTGNAQTDMMVNAFKQITEQYERKLTKIGKLAPAEVSYLGRYVVQGDEGVSRMMHAIQSKMPAEGPKSFAKRRTYPYFTDMLDAGLTPVTYNFVDAQLMKFEEMQRVLDMHEAEQQERAAGRWKNVMVGRPVPIDANGDEWERIDASGKDPAFTVYGPRTMEVEEGFDAKVREGLNRAIRSIPGLTHDRKTGQMRVDGQKALGYAVGPHGNYMASQFGTESGVIMHELGHILDFKYGLGGALRSTPKGAAQLRALADMRADGMPEALNDPKFAAYLHKPEEEAANALHAYLYAPELMKQVAPEVQRTMNRWLDAGAAQGYTFAKVLRELKPSLTIASAKAELPIPGIRIMGHAYAPKASAQVWNNYLSRGISGNPLYRLWRAPSNAMVQSMLGVSGFHAMTTSFDAAFSEAARHLQQLVNPGRSFAERAKAGATLIPKSIIAPVSHLALGHKILKEFRIPGLHPELQQVLDQMIEGGFKVSPAQNERLAGMLNGIKNALEKDARVSDRIKGMGAAAWNAPWAAIEQAARPVMAGWVPRLKAAAIYLKVSDDLAKRQGPITKEELRRVAGEAVDNADFRLGQVMRDNHFVNKTADNIASALVLAPGWTTGTLVLGTKAAKEAGGAAYDAARGKRPVLGNSAAYAIAMVVGTAIWGALTTKSMTGDDPKDAKDLFFARDGTYDPDGNPNRINPPTYLTHDVHGYFTHFWRTLIGKLNPAISTVASTLQNKDYFGNEIYNPQDNLPTKAKQIGAYAGKAFVPLSIRNYMEGKRRNDAGVTAGGGSFFGFTPASKETVRSPAQNLMNELLVAHGHAQLTPEASAESREKQNALADLRRGSTGAFQQMIADGKLSRAQIAAAMKKVSQLSLIARFQQLSLDEAREVMAVASPVERNMWLPYMQLKIVREAQSGRTSHLQPQ